LVVVWFARNSADTAPSSNYQDPKYSVPVRQQIITTVVFWLLFAGTRLTKTPQSGASTRLAALSWRLIAEGLMLGRHWRIIIFITFMDKTYLSFANNDAVGAPWGGLFEGCATK